MGQGLRHLHLSGPKMLDAVAKQQRCHWRTAVTTEKNAFPQRTDFPMPSGKAPHSSERSDVDQALEQGVGPCYLIDSTRSSKICNLNPWRVIHGCWYQPVHSFAVSELGCRNQLIKDTTDPCLPHKGAPPGDRRRAAGGIKQEDPLAFSEQPIQVARGRSVVRPPKLTLLP